MPLTIRADAVLFGSDGVLVDSHAQVDAAWSALATEFAVSPGRDGIAVSIALG